MIAIGLQIEKWSKEIHKFFYEFLTEIQKIRKNFQFVYFVQLLTINSINVKDSIEKFQKIKKNGIRPYTFNCWISLFPDFSEFLWKKIRKITRFYWKSRESGNSGDFIENKENQEVWEAKIYRTRNSLV